MTLSLAAVGRELPPLRRSWTDTDTLLYALSVGEHRLEFVTENSHAVRQQVLPTFAVIVCDTIPALGLVGEVPLSSVLHGADEIVVTAPLPAAGALVVTTGVGAVYDRGVGRPAVVELRGTGREPTSGAVVVERTTTLVIRGAGGFGGPPPPGRPPDGVDALHDAGEEAVDIASDLALLYRLNGDRNPLHSDPWAARQVGFDAPILHGLCTFGVIGRLLLHRVAGSDPSRIARMSVRFTAPVVPPTRLVVASRSDHDTTVWTCLAGEGGSAVAHGSVRLRADAVPTS